MDGRFDGRVAAITGAASGIGAATARRLGREGARLSLCDRNGPGLETLAAELGRDVAVTTLDVSDREAVESWIEATVERSGRLDVLFNNAGIGSYGKTPDVDPARWHRIIDVDLHAVFYGCRAAIPHFRKQGGGVIVNTASISGLFGDYGLAAYNAAKAAVVNYTRTAALDHARENIRVNCVCPGAIDTMLTAPLLSSAEVAADYERLIPMGRVGRAEEIAAVVAFLASDDASYVTGAAVVADGGMTAGTGQISLTRYLETDQ